MIERADSTLVDALHPSPNAEPRRGPGRPDMIVLHYTGMRSCELAIDWLSRPVSRVSCHYVIDVDGRTTQLVPEALRAWHAGVSAWAGETDINSCSIGFEIHNPGHDDGYPDFPEAQMQRVIALARDCIGRWQIPPERVLAHSDVAPARKIDPGERFDWPRLFRERVGLWVPPHPLDVDDAGLGPGEASRHVLDVQRLLATYGYAIEATGVMDPATVTIIAAFQRHFRPARVDGRLDPSMASTLADLVEALKGGAPEVA